LTTPVVSKAVIRFARKRLTAWSPDRADHDVQRVEFTTRDGAPDLRPSVFEIELKDLIRAYSEFATLRQTLDTTFGIDVAGVPWRFDRTPGGTSFRFTEAAHREVVLRDEGDLLDFIREIRRGFENRNHKVEKVQVTRYAEDRLAKGDPEWLAALDRARRDRPESWVAKLVRANAQSAD